jgi:replicative DNA helicase
MQLECILKLYFCKKTAMMNTSAITQIKDFLNKQLTVEALKGLIIDDYEEVKQVDTSESLSSLTNTYIKDWQAQKVESSFIYTGFPTLDALTGGFCLGDFIVVAARPGMGKTQLMVDLTLRFSRAGFPVHYFTFDLSKKGLTDRFIACESGIALHQVIHHQLNEQEASKIWACDKSLSETLVGISEDIQQSLTGFIALCVDLVTNKGIKVIVIDYLQLLSTFRFKNNREQQIALITRELKKMARAHKVCVIATSQLSRSVETRGGDKRPMLSDLRESGAIEQDADKVLFLYRPEYYQITEDEYGNSTIGQMEVIVAKNKTGITSTANLMVNAHFTSFSDGGGIYDITLPADRLSEI